MELTAGVKKRKPAGWNVITTPAPKPIVVEEAPIVGIPLNFLTLVEAHERVFGNKARWHMVSEGREITADERTRLLEAALGDLSVNVENVRALDIGLNERNSQGWAFSMSFGVLTRIAEEWLAERGASIKEATCGSR